MGLLHRFAWFRERVFRVFFGDVARLVIDEFGAKKRFKKKLCAVEFWEFVMCIGLCSLL